MQNEFRVERVDTWINRSNPDLGAVIRRLAQVRDVQRQARIAEAHLIRYGMELMNLDYELQETPTVLLPPSEEDLGQCEVPDCPRDATRIWRGRHGVVHACEECYDENNPR